MSCNCIKLIQAELKTTDLNTQLDIPFSIDIQRGRMSTPMVRLAVVKLNPKVRKKPTTLVATYCPFCGKKYEEIKTSDNSKKKQASKTCT